MKVNENVSSVQIQNENNYTSDVKLHT